MIDSTSDDRVKNNVMRHAYRTLSDDEKQQMQRLKDAGLEFIELLHSVGGTLAEYTEEPGEHVRLASRELSLAQTKIEEAVMWGVKHVTR